MGWNESEAALGFWYYEQEGAEHDYDYLVPNNLLGECESYTDGFDEAFIEKDRTWKVSRIMAIVAGLSSTLAAFISWLFCLTPLPPSFLWPAIFLPLVMVAFISEGSKFLVLDIGVCRTNVWLPSGVNSLPQTAESCELGESAIYSIAAGAFMLCALLLICLRVPHERELDPHFGMLEPDDKDEAEDTDEHHEDEENPYGTYYADGHIGQTASSAQGQVSDFDNGEDDLVISHDFDAALTGGVNNKDSNDGNENEEDTEVPSESRSTTLANLEASQAQDTDIGNSLLEKLVDDLNCTYQSTPREKSAEESNEEPKEE
jgi:hypothetical protein